MKSDSNNKLNKSEFLSYFLEISTMISRMDSLEHFLNEDDGIKPIEGYDASCHHLEQLADDLKRKNTPELEILLKLIIRNFRKCTPVLKVSDVRRICLNILDGKTRVKLGKLDTNDFRPFKAGKWEFRRFTQEIYYDGKLFCKPGRDRWKVVEFLIEQLEQGINTPYSSDLFNYYEGEQLREQQEEGRFKNKKVKRKSTVIECGFKHNGIKNKIWKTLIKTGKEGQESIIFFDFNYIPLESELNEPAPSI